jgi:hypothetical protein
MKGLGQFITDLKDEAAAAMQSATEILAGLRQHRAYLRAELADIERGLVSRGALEARVREWLGRCRDAFMRQHGAALLQVFAAPPPPANRPMPMPIPDADIVIAILLGACLDAVPAFVAALPAHGSGRAASAEQLRAQIEELERKEGDLIDELQRAGVAIEHEPEREAHRAADAALTAQTMGQ